MIAAKVVSLCVVVLPVFPPVAPRVSRPRFRKGELAFGAVDQSECLYAVFSVLAVGVVVIDKI